MKKGDKVILISKCWGDEDSNPLWGGSQGHVIGSIGSIGSSRGLDIHVDWDNDYCNSYKRSDLRSAPSELTRKFKQSTQEAIKLAILRIRRES